MAFALDHRHRNDASPDDLRLRVGVDVPPGLVGPAKATGCPCRSALFFLLTGTRMPILDTHVRVAAWLHIVMGTLAAATLMLVALAFGLFGAFAATQPQGGIVGWFLGFGAIFVGFFVALSVLEVVGAVMLLRGSSAGRVITIIFSVLDLLGFPFFTILGAYSLWALLREAPQPATATINMPSGNTGSY